MWPDVLEFFQHHLRVFAVYLGHESALAAGGLWQYEPLSCPGTMFVVAKCTARAVRVLHSLAALVATGAV